MPENNPLVGERWCHRHSETVDVYKVIVIRDSRIRMTRLCIKDFLRGDEWPLEIILANMSFLPNMERTYWQDHAEQYIDCIESDRNDNISFVRLRKNGTIRSQEDIDRYILENKPVRMPHIDEIWVHNISKLPCRIRDCSWNNIVYEENGSLMTTYTQAFLLCFHFGTEKSGASYQKTVWDSIDKDDF